MFTMVSGPCALDMYLVLVVSFSKVQHIYWVSTQGWVWVGGFKGEQDIVSALGETHANKKSFFNTRGIVIGTA